jgi:hypothetical protein
MLGFQAYLYKKTSEAGSANVPNMVVNSKIKWVTSQHTAQEKNCEAPV